MNRAAIIRGRNPWSTTINMAVLFVTVSALSACQSLGTVVTKVDMEMTVRAEGQSVPSTGATFVVGRPARSLIPFDNPGYRDERLEWWIQVPLSGISMFMTNHAGRPVLLRWDQSSWRSSDHPGPVPLRVHRLSTGYLGSQQVYVEIDPDAPAVLPVAVELETGAALPVNVRPDWRPLFPQGFMFGIKKVDKGYGFIDDGIGRWFELELPVEMNGERWAYRIRVTARDVGQWTSYH